VALYATLVVVYLAGSARSDLEIAAGAAMADGLIPMDDGINFVKPYHEFFVYDDQELVPQNIPPRGSKSPD